MEAQKKGGKKEIPDQESFWETRPEAKNINDFGLCKSSEQYLIDANMLTDIYAEIDQW